MTFWDKKEWRAQLFLHQKKIQIFSAAFGIGADVGVAPTDFLYFGLLWNFSGFSLGLPKQACCLNLLSMDTFLLNIVKA